MHSAIIVVTKPDSLKNGLSRKWLALVHLERETLDPFRNHPGVAPLAENMWQVIFKRARLRLRAWLIAQSGINFHVEFCNWTLPRSVLIPISVKAAHVPARGLAIRADPFYVDHY